jgi:hypothetical protein
VAIAKACPATWRGDVEIRPIFAPPRCDALLTCHGRTAMADARRRELTRAPAAALARLSTRAVAMNSN